MATYNNKHWLLSHIKNSFISTDDTGMCEIVMLGEDLPKQLYTRCLQEKNKIKHSNANKSQSNTPDDESDKEYLAEYEPYPELDASDEDDFDSLAESYDIQYDMDFGLHRQRSNTAQRLEKLEQAQRKASKTRIVKWESPTIQLSDDERARLFTRKELQPKTRDGNLPKSLLSDQLKKCTFLPHNQYLEYAKFDGQAQMGLPTKSYKIFMIMLPDDHRNYPFSVCVVSTAKVQDLIGYICYKYSVVFPEVTLGPVANYGLYISEDDGEVDWDFPSLDLREPCSKFGLTSLALVDLKSKNANRHKDVQSCSIPDRGGLHSVVMNDDQTTNRSRSATFDSTDKANVIVISNIKDSAKKDKTKGAQRPGNVTFEDRHRTTKVILNNLPTLGDLQSASDVFFRNQSVPLGRASSHSPQDETIARMETHKLAVEAPQYQSYDVQLCHRVPLPQTNINIGISGDRIELNPLHGNSNKFWNRLKPVSYNIDSVAWCEIIESKSSRATFRLVYSLSYGPNVSGSNRHHGLLQTSASFKHHDFETDFDTCRDIVEKINRILELRSSACRKEYRTAKERKQQARRSFHLPKSNTDNSYK